RHTSFSRDWSSDVCSSDLAEMAAVGVGVADVLHDGEFAFAEEVAHGGAGFVEGDFVVERKGGVFRDGDVGAEIEVAGIFVGDAGVEAVVSTGELDEDEDGAVFFGGGGSGESALREEVGSVLAEGEKSESAAGGAEEFASGEWAGFHWKGESNKG